MLGAMLMSRQQHEHADWQGARMHVRPAGAMRTWHPAMIDDKTINISGIPRIVAGPNKVLNTTPANDDTLENGTLSPGSYNYIVGIDAFDEDGISGLNNSNPPETFVNHFVVKYGGKIYDPSYGAGPFDSENSHENAAIDGIIKSVKIGTGKIYTIKINNAESQELTYTRQAGLE